MQFLFVEVAGRSGRKLELRREPAHHSV